jgi:hypothetical protein
MLNRSLFLILALTWIALFLAGGEGQVAGASPLSSQSVNLCTEQAIGHDGDLFKTVHHFIGMLGKPFCFQFLRWRYLDAFVDVPKHQVVKSIDVIKLLIPGSPDWSNSTRLARCRAFYPDEFQFIKQVGFVRYYTSPQGKYTTTLGVDSCFIRATWEERNKEGHGKHMNDKRLAIGIVIVALVLFWMKICHFSLLSLGNLPGSWSDPPRYDTGVSSNPADVSFGSGFPKGNYVGNAAGMAATTATYKAAPEPAPWYIRPELNGSTYSGQGSGY